MTSNTWHHAAPHVVNSHYEDLLEEFRRYLDQAGFSAGSLLPKFMSATRHFLLWGWRGGLELEAIDESTLIGFRDHDCCCFAWKTGGTQEKLKSSLGRTAVSGAIRFVQFLEDSGRTSHPNELAVGNRLLEDFLEEMKVSGYGCRAIDHYRNAAQHFLVWLHRWRIPIRYVNSTTIDSFLGHDCLCPGYVRTPNTHSRASKYAYAVRAFVSFLVRRGAVSEWLASSGAGSAQYLQEYRFWLERTRGICAVTIRAHTNAVSLLLEDLGPDASRYDAELIRNVLLKRTQERSLTYAKRLASSLRMFLRFLSSEGACPADLVNAVVSPRRWRLSTLPRYISMEEVERVIASCDPATAVGARDRAVLLLLARLGLRSGDVSKLLLSDIDWRNAQVSVSGKSKRPANLPLPQDVGDALLQYIRTARPRVDSGYVFVRLMAPFTPFSSSSTVSRIVLRALARAGVEPAGCRGGHLFRHSLATHMLRSGASLDAIGALLRHESVETTRIYAKTDVPMLQEVSQPWLGGAR